MSNAEEIGKLVDTMVSRARRETLDEVSKAIRKLLDAEWEETCDTETDTYTAYVQALVEVNKLWHKKGEGK